MHLSKVEIVGFKSFAKKTDISLHSGLTAVVGPNGCGKTNVVDAIRWALGEQKASVLRSDRMETVIFNGSETKKPLGMAEVSLLLDNSDKMLPIEYTEVLLTRRLYRSGESEYLLNKTPCRLKDIVDLFADTGVGPDAYSVIELKMVESIISDKSEDRRGLFEEAAGITKFKQRRQAAFRKLEETNKDLLRVDDLLSEVERTVNSLRRQVRKTERYNELREISEQKEREICTFRWALIQKQRIPLTSQKMRHTDESVHYNAAIAQHEAAVETHKQELHEWESRYNAVHRDYNELVDAVNKEHMGLTVCQERTRHLTDQIEKIRREWVNLGNQLIENKEKWDEAVLALRAGEVRRQEETTQVQREEGDLKTFHEEYVQKREQVEGAQREVIEVIQECAAKERVKDRLESELQDRERQGKRLEVEMQRVDSRLDEREYHKTLLETELQKLFGDIDRQAIIIETLEGERERAESALANDKELLLRHKHHIQNLNHQITFLEQISADAAGSAEGEKLLLASRENIAGLVGAVGEVFHVDETYRRSVLAALGKRADYILFDTTENALMAMDYLREVKGGKASMIPLDFVRRRTSTHRDAMAVSDSRIIGRACDFIQCEEQYRPLASLLLADALIVQTQLTEWLNTTNGEYADVTIVDMSGNMIDRNGCLYGGDGEFVSNHLFDKEKELERLRREIQDMEQTMLELENGKREIVRRLEALQKDITDASAIMRKLNTRREEVERQHAVVDNELSKDKEFVARIKKERAQISLFHDQQIELNNLMQEVQTSQERKIRAEESLQELRRVAAELEKKWSERERQFQELRMRLFQTEEENKRLQAEIAQREKTHEDIVRRQEDGKSLVLQYESEKEELKKKELEFADGIQSLIGRKSEKEEQLENIRQQQDAVKSRIEELEQGIRHIRAQRENIGETLHEIDITLTHLGHEEAALLERLKTTPELDLESWNGTDEELRALEGEVEALRQKLESLGQLNFAALEEYHQEKDRFDNLSKQRADIIEAEQTLQETISKINVTARDLFSAMLEKVRANFKEIFGQFFAQGEADIMLMGDDPLEARVDIVAQPFGKRMQSISLLSAGEKTLTAIALLLAIYKVKPSPFCILDEVDAPLDDSNIDRFVSAMRSFARTTQFIVITHNKRTMEAASYIYGVTMEENGVSKVVSVRME